MKPSNELIEKFQKQYLQEFGEEISQQHAHEEFMRIVDLLRVVLQLKPNNIPGAASPGVSFPGFDENSENGNVNTNI